MSRQQAIGGLLAAALVLVAFVAGGAQAASTIHLNCGDTITQNTKLANDLIDCPGNGIVIGADNITLDLNDHMVDGDGLGDYNGVDNTAGHDGVTIKDGSVREFVEGIFVRGATNNRLTGLSTSHQGHGGIVVAESTDVRVERNVSISNLAGIILSAVSHVRVEHNVVSDSEFSGIVLFESENIRIAENSVSGSHNDAGIGIYPGNNNVIERNAISDSAAGITLAFGSADNLVRKNAVSGNGDGVILDVGTHDNRVTENTLRDSFFGGIAIVGSDDNVIAQNSIVGNNTGGSEAGIHVLSWPDDPRETSDRNLMSKNTLVGNTGDGILVDADQSENVIERNWASENTDDGIDIDSPATTLTKNTANRNHDLGIEAVPGVDDGGGNKAKGNGNPAQCTNIVCEPS